jgi:hypothetical protein
MREVARDTTVTFRRWTRGARPQLTPRRRASKRTPPVEPTRVILRCNKIDHRATDLDRDAIHGRGGSSSTSQVFVTFVAGQADRSVRDGAGGSSPPDLV